MLLSRAVLLAALGISISISLSVRFGIEHEFDIVERQIHLARHFNRASRKKFLGRKLGLDRILCSDYGVPIDFWIHQRNSTAAIMANHDPPPNLLRFVIQCQNRLAALTMHPADYQRYNEIEHNFLTLVIPYDEFRDQMEALLDQQTAPHYEHLRLFWGIYRRAVLGQELLLDNVWFLFPVACTGIMDVFIDNVRTQGTLRNWVGNPDPVRERRVAAQRAREASLRRNLNIESNDSIREPDPDMNHDVILVCFLNWCQEEVARVMMNPQDYEEYLRITSDYRNGIISYHLFIDQILTVIMNPSYHVLWVWWNVHQQEVYGGLRMLDNRMSRFPFTLLILMTLVKYCEVFGHSLWDTFLDHVRRRMRR